MQCSIDYHYCIASGLQLFITSGPRACQQSSPCTVMLTSTIHCYYRLTVTCKLTEEIELRTGNMVVLKCLAGLTMYVGQHTAIPLLVHLC